MSVSDFTSFNSQIRYEIFSKGLSPLTGELSDYRHMHGGSQDIR